MTYRKFLASLVFYSLVLFSGVLLSPASASAQTLSPAHQSISQTTAAAVRGLVDVSGPCGAYKKLCA